MNDNREPLSNKQLGYLLSVAGILISNIGMWRHWSVTPLLVLITMYFLAGSLWFPVLIKPFYRLFRKITSALSKNEK